MSEHSQNSISTSQEPLRAAEAPLPHDTPPSLSHLIFGRGILSPPLPIHQEARERFRTGKSPSVKQALKDIAAERSQPNVVVAAVSKMFSREESLLKKRSEAAAKLKEFDRAIAREQNAALELVTQRERLRTVLGKARERSQSIVHKRDRIAERLQQTETHFKRYLSNVQSCDWMQLERLGLPVHVLRLAATEMARQTSEAETALKSAEHELATFEAAHADDLAIVSE